MPSLRRARGEHVVKNFGASFDGLRQEVWVRNLEN